MNWNVIFNKNLYKCISLEVHPARSYILKAKAQVKTKIKCKMTHCMNAFSTQCIRLSSFSIVFGLPLCLDCLMFQAMATSFNWTCFHSAIKLSVAWLIVKNFEFENATEDWLMTSRHFTHVTVYFSFVSEHVFDNTNPVSKIQNESIKSWYMLQPEHIQHMKSSGFARMPRCSYFLRNDQEMFCICIPK